MRSLALKSRESLPTLRSPKYCHPPGQVWPPLCTLISSTSATQLDQRRRQAVVPSCGSPSGRSSSLGDVALQRGTNYPRGPVEWARGIGHARVARLLRALNAEAGDGRYEPAGDFASA